MRKRGVRTGCENTECLFRLLSGLVLLRPPRYPPALAPILPFFSFNSSARLQKSQFLHPSLCKCLRKLERSVYSSLRTSLAVQAHDQLIQMSFQLYVTAAPPIWPFYRPSYDRNSWQNCFMVIKIRNEFMFILATICRTEGQKSLSIIARFTGGANLLLEQCECRSCHFPLHLYLWKKARERVLDLNPRDCVIVFYPEGHQRDSRACFYCTAEAVKAPEEVRFSRCKILTAKTPVYRHQHRAQVDLPAPPAWPITYERSHEGGRQLDKSARGLSN